MSFIADRFVKRIIKSNPLTRSQSLVLLTLADYHNKNTSQLNPSLSNIAIDSKMSITTAQRALRGLESLNIIQTIPQRISQYGGIIQSSNQYIIVNLEEYIRINNNNTSQGADKSIRGLSPKTTERTNQTLTAMLSAKLTLSHVIIETEDEFRIESVICPRK